VSFYSPLDFRHPRVILLCVILSLDGAMIYLLVYVDDILLTMSNSIVLLD